MAIVRRQDCLRHSTLLLWSGINAIALRAMNFYFVAPVARKFLRVLVRDSLSPISSGSSSHVRLETQSHHGLSSVPYQRRTISPKNIQASAPNARYGPKGSLADQTGFPTTSVTKPITEPRSDPANKAEQNRAPAKKCADRGEKFQVAAAHCLARNHQLARDAGNVR